MCPVQRILRPDAASIRVATWRSRCAAKKSRRCARSPLGTGARAISQRVLRPLPARDDLPALGSRRLAVATYDFDTRGHGFMMSTSTGATQTIRRRYALWIAALAALFVFRLLYGLTREFFFEDETQIFLIG